MKWLKLFSFFVESIKIEESTEDFINVSILDDNNNKIGSFQLESYDGKNYTIIDAFIDEDHRRMGFYKKSILDLLNARPDIIIISVFRSEEASRAWDKLIETLPPDFGFTKKFHRAEKTMEFKLFKNIL
jgi:hypothetical protein